MAPRYLPEEALMDLFLPEKERRLKIETWLKVQAQAHDEAEALEHAINAARFNPNAPRVIVWEHTEAEEARQ